LIKKDKKDSKPRPRSVAGFTLIEALAVIVIIGFLASIIIVKTGDAKKQGEGSAVQGGLRELKNAAELYYNQLYTFEGVCDGANVTLSDVGDFGRIKSYINSYNGEGGVIGCRDSDEAFVVISSLSLGDCWCIDYQGISKKLELSAGQACDDLLVTTNCP